MNLFHLNNVQVADAGPLDAPIDLERERNESEWDSAADEATEAMTRPEAVAEAFDEGGILLPASMAELISLAYTLRKTRTKAAGSHVATLERMLAITHEAIGDALVDFAEESICKACKAAAERALA